MLALRLIFVGILIIMGRQLSKYTGAILFLAPIVDFIPLEGWSLGSTVSAVAVFLIGLSMFKQRMGSKEG